MSTTMGCGFRMPRKHCHETRIPTIVFALPWLTSLLHSVLEGELSRLTSGPDRKDKETESIHSTRRAYGTTVNTTYKRHDPLAAVHARLRFSDGLLG